MNYGEITTITNSCLVLLESNFFLTNNIILIFNNIFILNKNKMAKELTEIKRNSTGYGFLIERDAGYISLDDEKNAIAKETLNNIGRNEPGIEIVDRLKVVAVLQKFGVENANGRIYPEQILKKQVEIYQAKIKRRQSYGESNHPEDITLNLDRLAFGITRTWWEGRTLLGELELILSPGFVKMGIISCEGDRIANYLRLGWLIGISSRGLGSVEKDRYSGKLIVQDDFEITCWDIVSDPSTNGSYLGADKESIQQYVESKTINKPKLIEGLDNFLQKRTIL